MVYEQIFSDSPASRCGAARSKRRDFKISPTTLLLVLLQRISLSRESSAAAAPTDRIALRSLHIHIPLVVTAPPSPSFHFSRNLPDVCDGHNVRQRDHDCHGAQLLLPRPYARIGAAVGADVSFPSPSPHSCVFVDFYSHSATQIIFSAVQIWRQRNFCFQQPNPPPLL